MNRQIVIPVIGIPKAQPRARATIRGGRAGTYNPETADDWKSAIYDSAKSLIPDTPIEGPVQVDAFWFFPRPGRLNTKSKRHVRFAHWVKPDRDNLDKAVLDVLSMLGFWNDDKQVCSGRLQKVYADYNGRVGAVIYVSEIEDSWRLVNAALGASEAYSELKQV